jgi:hypothetical protein
LPYVFTEHGAIQASNVLASPQAVEMGVFVVRAFVRLRAELTTHQDVAAKLDVLELKTELLSVHHDNLAANTRAQFKQVFDAIRQLMTPTEPPKRGIGFVTETDKRSTSATKIQK